MRYLYSRWDGTQQIPALDAESLMEALADDLLSDGDVWQALQRLLQWGYQGPDGRRLPGLQDLLERLRQAKQERLSRYNLNSIVDQIREKLDQIVATERRGLRQRLEEARQAAAAARERGEEPPNPALLDMLEKMVARKEQFLDNLPHDLGGAIRALSDYEFMDPTARQLFQELLQMLQQQVAQSYFQGLQQALQGLTPDDLRRLREMVQDLNQLLRERLQGGQPDFDRFMDKWGQLFPGVQSLDELLEQLQQRMQQMRALLDSLSPEMRRQLQSLIDNILQDDRLRWDLAALAATLEQLMPSRSGRQRFPFSGDEPLTLTEALDLMGQLQELEQLERQIRRARDGQALDQVDAAEVERLLGPEARQALEQLQQVTRILEEAGYIVKRGATYELTPRAIRKIGQKALTDIFAQLKRDRFGKHVSPFRGGGGDRTDEVKPYEFGDPFLLDLRETLMNAVVREGKGVPVHLQPDDFAVYRTEYLTQCATVLMLDMSRSMLLRGCFLAAKKVAMALNSLIRGQFPQDTLYILGFSDYAREISPEMLPRIDWSEYVYGTNMQHGFMVARQLLARHKGGTRQIILITDGEPTAHLENGRVHFAYPPTYQTIRETLKEVMQCTREGITINTFMLERSRYLTDFVNQMTRINKGRAFFTSPDRLGEYILVDYVANKRKRIG
jgi:uncharacterized protein with von Willebrand factor type A (vWA) domain